VSDSGPAVVDASDVAWSGTQRVAFRLICAYLVLYYLPFPLMLAPFLEPVQATYNTLWHTVVPWVGQHLLHLATPITIFENGSGDTTYNYVQLLCLAGVALVATLIWSVVDRGRRQYVTAHRWLRVYLRYSLCPIMVVYGAMKIIPVQFGSLSLSTLLQPYGNASPMGLLWNFMGYSTPYTVFAGYAEMLAGLLLIPRRTTTVGAMLAMAVLSNVVMLNFSYDVPVKLFSVHLLCTAAVLLLPELRRLVDFHLLNRAVAGVPAQPLFRKPRHDLVARGIGLLYVAGTTAMSLWGAWQGYKASGAVAPAPPVYGIFEVSTFVRNRDTLPPLATDSSRWRRLVFERGGWAVIRTMNDSGGYFGVAVDTAKGQVSLDPLNLAAGWAPDTTRRVTLGYQRPDSVHLMLAGLMGSDSIRVELIRRDEKEFLLLKRGFHWINEYPFNR
jgi:hypothetical protein